MSFNFNSIDFATYGVEVLDGFEVTGATTIPTRVLGLPAAARVWYSKGESAPTVIEFPVRIQKTTPALLVAALDDINAALSTTADASLIYWHADRHWMGRWDGVALKCSVLNSTTLTTRIRFFCQPGMVATLPSTDHFHITGNPQTFYIPGPNLNSGVVAGNTTVAPVLVLQNTGGAMGVDTLQIWNATTGDYLNYGDSIPNNRYVKFDCETRRVYTSTDGTAWTQVYGKVTTDWLTITGGTAATLTVIGCAGGILTWTYTGRYL